jgi:tetratricopeptide (TPR) repeat protein
MYCINKKLTVSIVFLFVILSGQTQTKIDSLKLAWSNKLLDDSTRLAAVNELILNNYLYSQPDSTLYYAQKLYDFAEKRELKAEMAHSLNILGVAYMENGDFLTSKKYFEQSLKIKKANSTDQNIANTLNNLAILYAKFGNYDKSINYQNQSLTISEKKNDSLGKAQSLSNIATLYNRMGSYDKALEYNNLALQISKELRNRQGIAICYHNLGVIFSRKADFDTAIYYYNKAQALQKQLNNKLAEAKTLANIGTVKNMQGYHAEAVEYQNRSLEIYEAIDNKEGVSGTYINIGSIYQTQGHYSKAIIYLNKGLRIASQTGLKENIAAAAKGLYEAYKALGDTHMALKMYEQYTSVHDSLQSDKNRRELIHQEYKYKYLQIHLADSLRNAQALELERKEHQKNAEIERNQRYSIIAFFLLILTFMAIIIRNRAIKIKNEKEVLLKEIEVLRSNAVIYTQQNERNELDKQLNKDKICSKIDGSLNETDWRILTVLCSKPTINNRKISEEISLSFEGVRSSLKKMYRIFDIQKSKENQRIALVIKAIQLSNA